MERISVRVLAEAYNGQFKPLEVYVEDQQIVIKRILSVQPIKSRKDYEKSVGVRYLVRSDQLDFVLVYDERWWIEVG